MLDGVDAAAEQAPGHQNSGRIVTPIRVTQSDDQHLIPARRLHEGNAWHRKYTDFSCESIARFA